MSLESLSISTPVLTMLLCAALLAFLIMSAVFVFHWKQYGMKTGTIYLAEGIYFSVSACLIVFAALFFIALI